MRIVAYLEEEKTDASGIGLLKIFKASILPPVNQKSITSLTLPSGTRVDGHFRRRNWRDGLSSSQNIKSTGTAAGNLGTRTDLPNSKTFTIFRFPIILYSALKRLGGWARISPQHVNHAHGGNIVRKL